MAAVIKAGDLVNLSLLERSGAPLVRDPLQVLAPLEDASALDGLHERGPGRRDSPLRGRQTLPCLPHPPREPLGDVGDHEKAVRRSAVAAGGDQGLPAGHQLSVQLAQSPGDRVPMLRRSGQGQGAPVFQAPPVTKNGREPKAERHRAG